MKKIGLFILFIIGMVILWQGRTHWQNQMDEMADKSRLIIEDTKTTRFNLDYAKNLPQSIIDKLTNGETVTLTLMARNQEDWAEHLRDAINEAYGRGVWTINILTYGDMTSAEMANDDQFTQIQPDMILFEVPLLNDNLSEDINFDGTTAWVTNLLANWSESIVWLQPQNPIHQGVNYPNQVATLMEMLTEQGYTHLDHWQNWPDFNSEEILPYLDEEGLRPIEGGISFWQEYLVNKFIARQEN